MNVWSLALSLAALGYVLFGVIFNEAAVWTNPEIPAYFYPRAFETGKGLHWNDLGRVFDWEAFCGGARTRIASTLLLIFNAKFRQYWLDWFSPHASLNVAWVWALVLTPLSFYWAAKELLKDRLAAFHSMLVYIVSTGSLSGIAFNHHPGKPISNFFLALAFGLTFRIRNRLARSENVRGEWISMGVVVGCGMLFDEVPFFLLLLVPLLLWEYRKKKAVPLAAITSLGVPFVIVTAFFLLLAPAISDALGYNGYPLFRYATTPDSPHHGVRISAILENLVLLPKDQLPALGGLYLSAVVVVAVFVFGYFVGASKTLLLSVILFSLLQTLLMSRVSSDSLGGTFYYGSGFSIIFSLYLGELLQKVGSRWRPALLAILLGCGVYHFQMNNREWQQGHLKMYQTYFNLPAGETPERLLHHFLDWERLQHQQSWEPVSNEGFEKGRAFRGKKLSDVEAVLGRSEDSCGLAETLTYRLDEKRRLVFLPTNHHLRVRKVMVLPACTVR